MSKIDRYIARLIFIPLVANLTIAFAILIIDKMRRLFDFVATEGGPVRVVWRMLANLIPEYLSLGIPIGLMLGILLAFRRLATSSELDVLRGVGMGFGRLLRVPYAFAIALALLNLAIVGFIQPYARYAYEGLQFDLRSGALGASIKVGEFTKLGNRMTLRIEESYNDGRSLRGTRALSRCPSFSSDFVDTSSSGSSPRFAAAAWSSMTFFFFCEGAMPLCHRKETLVSSTSRPGLSEGMKIGRSATSKS